MSSSQINSRSNIAIGFLRSVGFDHGRPIADGIPYLSRKEEQELRLLWAQRDHERAALTDMLPKNEDAPLILHARTAIQRWQGQDPKTREHFLNIPDTSQGAIKAVGIPEMLNRYQIRLIHQIIRNEYPNCKTAGKGHFIQITMLDTEREVSEKAEEARLRDRDIARATGLRWVIEALCGSDITKIPAHHLRSIFPVNDQSDHKENPALKSFLDNLQAELATRRRILAGHNCFGDLIFLYECFIGDLPDSVLDLPVAIRPLFPAVVDTKFLASFGPGWHNTGLAEVEVALKAEDKPVTEIPAEFSRYSGGNRYHEAGYDSLITAQIVIKLSAKLERGGKYPTYKEKELVCREDTESEQYLTATESNTDTEPEMTFTSALLGALASPLTAVHSFFQSDLASTGDQFTSDSGTTHGDSPISESVKTPTQASNGHVLAVKKKPIDWSRSAEVDKVKAAFSRTSIGDVLVEDGRSPPISSIGDGRGRSHSPVSDLMVWSDQEDEEEPTEQDLGKQDQGQLVADDGATSVPEPEMMPRWDGARGFWKIFGNRLQVNGAEEGVCEL